MALRRRQGLLVPRPARRRRASGALRRRAPARYESWELGIVLAGDVYAGRTPVNRRGAADVATLKGTSTPARCPRRAAPDYRAEEPDGSASAPASGSDRADVRRRRRPYGSLGEVHPRVVEAWGLAGRPVDAAIDLDRLFDLVPAERRSRPISAAQPIDRDLAVVVDEATPVGRAAARRADERRATACRAAPVRRLPRRADRPGRVSYAISLRFQPDEPGDDKAVEKALNKVRGSLRHHLGAEIR